MDTGDGNLQYVVDVEMLGEEHQGRLEVVEKNWFEQSLNKAVEDPTLFGTGPGSEPSVKALRSRVKYK